MEMPLAVRERLEHLRDATEAESLAEVIRRSLAIYETLWRVEREEGAKVIVRYPQGDERDLLII